MSGITIGKVKLNLGYYSGEDLYSDGAIENEISGYVNQFGEEHLEDILSLDRRWPVVYHLSPFRKNLLNWYPFKQGCEILELGAGMGALTGVLCDSAARVVACELSKKRAMIAARRHSERDNLEIYVGNAMDLQLVQKFDYVTLIGVLEYAPTFIKSNPFEALLLRARSLLKDDGRLLIAIENRFGLKYWCGAPEDHTGVPYSGINGYNGASVRTFGKAEITALLEKLGFSHHAFYYPLPDYKLPGEIYSERELPEFSARGYFSSHTGEYRLSVDEREVQQEIIASGAFEFFANSFLIEAGARPSPGDCTVSRVRFNNERKAQYRTMLVFDGEQVVKKPASVAAQGHIKGIAENNRRLRALGFGTIDEVCEAGACRAEFSALPLFENVLVDALIRGEKENAAILINDFFEFAFQKLAGEKPCPGLVFEEGFPDLCFSNCFYDNGKYIIFDQEWAQRNLPAEFWRYRCINNMFERSDALKRMYDKAAFMAELGINAQDIPAHERAEAEFSSKVLSKDVCELFKTYRDKPLWDFSRLAALEVLSKGQSAELEELRGQQSTQLAALSVSDAKLRELERQLLETRQQEQQLRGELGGVYASRAWRWIERARRLKRRIKAAFGRTQAAPAAAPAQEQVIVSVVIPIYDRTHQLRESIESILAQTFRQFELLLVCDGSPPDTLEVVRAYENHPKVRVFYYGDNSGNAVRGRNRAIREAKGIYFAFMDSDDIAEPQRLALSVQCMQQCDVDVVYGAWRAIVEDREIDIASGQEVFCPDADYAALRESCVPCQSTVMAKVEALRFVGGLKPQMRYREDHELWARLAYFGYRFKTIDKVLCNLRLHAGNLELKYKSGDEKWRALFLAEHTKKAKLSPTVVFVLAGLGIISGGLVVALKHANYLYGLDYDVYLLSLDGQKQIDWYAGNNVPVITQAELPRSIDVAVATYWATEPVMDKLPARKKLYFVQADESEFYAPQSPERAMASTTYKRRYAYAAVAKWLVDWLKGEFEIDAHYIQNGIDEVDYTRIEPLTPRSRRLKVLLEGPLDVPFKGMDEAFEVVKGLDCDIWCVSGSGALKPGQQCTRFFEKVAHDEMPQIYASCDILLKMSRVDSFCLPALEMMLSGGVCVATKFKGSAEYMIHGENALLVDVGDIAGARCALSAILSDEPLRKRLAANAQKTAREWLWQNGPGLHAFKELIDSLC